MRRWAEPSAADLVEISPEAVFEAGMRNHHISNTAYPIAHEQTWKPYRVSREGVRSVVERAWSEVDPEAMCLYAHVPFCETRCSFCEYTVVKREEWDRTDEYMRAMERELEMCRAMLGRRTLHGFDIGGGTPSAVDASHIGRLVDAVRRGFEFAPGADISIETTPKIAAEEPGKLAAYKACGIERISMGVQVIQPDLLAVLNRSSNGLEHHLRARDNVRAAGFARFNVDLMYGFAGQSDESWEATLRHAIDLGPEYITLYRMRYKLTRVSHQAHEVTMEHVRAHQRMAKAMLSAAGFHANPGKTTYSRVRGDVGTSSYLARRVIEGMPYLGIGLGSQTFTHTTISYNDGAVGKNLAPYLRSVAAGELPIQDLYDLSMVQMAGKTCAVSFYFGEIDARAFLAKFGRTLEDVYGTQVPFLVREGLMERSERALSLTPRGVESLPGVIAQFFAPSLQQYLVERDPSTATDMDRSRRVALRVAGEPAGV